MLNFTSYHALIKEVATTHNLLPNAVEAVVIQESSGNTHAYRFEPQFWSRYLAKKEEWKRQVPSRVSASYGLMQIMYPTAVEVGFHGQPEELFIPLIGLTWGCVKLTSLLHWANGDYNSAFAAYNGGKADNEPGHKPILRNQTYATSVKTKLALLDKLPSPVV